MSTPTCCDLRRREIVRAGGVSNGIDFLEVLADPRELEVHLLDDPSAAVQGLRPEQVTVTGGVRIRGIRVESVACAGRVLTVRVDRPGDFSVYTLALAPVEGMDARLASIPFSFTVDCPTDFDCGSCPPCPPEPQAAPDIDYLTRDYAGFRRLMLDRLAVLVPELRERNPADLTVALVEAMAYAADHQSYRLDAVAMEASLVTARRRSSARRHARLVDHRTHDGSNARTWVQLRAAPGVAGRTVAAGTPLLTRIPWLATTVDPTSARYREALAAGPAVFETMHDAVLHEQRNTMRLHGWGDQECCLPAGATSATLVGHPPLAEGDVVVLAEVLGPRTGEEADADPAHRHAVRLVACRPTRDPIGGRFLDPPTGDAVDVTEISWGVEDAVPFAVCLSARAENRLVRDVSVVWGNIVLADHGRTQTREGAAAVPPADPRLTLPAAGGTRCAPAAPRQRPARFALTVPEPDVTMAGTLGRPLRGGDPRRPAAFDPSGSAASALVLESRHILPAVRLGDSDGQDWEPARDLLASGASAREFVVEVEADGTARCRFGGDGYGLRPRAETVFDIVWRRGNGPAGNIGGDALAHVVLDVPIVAEVRNPLPAQGGTAAEPLDRTRQDAPAAFLVPERAVTADDYTVMAQRHPQVQRAVATQRFTGSWYTVFLTVDRLAGLPIDAPFERDLRGFLERFRMAGDDLEIDGPRFVPLDVVLRVCVEPDYYASDVAVALRERLGGRRLPDGRRGFFDPDAYTFGTPVALSGLLAAAQEVAGVAYVEPLTFRRRGDDRSTALADGEIRTGRLEIARLDDDPSFPDHGTLRLEMEGGR